MNRAPPCTVRPRAWPAALLTLAVLWLAACTTQAPIVPYPEVVYVPHPLRPGADSAPLDAAGADALLEDYSASPDRNPDGLGVLDSIWLNSRMTLVTWPVARAREMQNRVAYARSDAEQAERLHEAQALYGAHWVFEGLLLGDVDATVSVDFYQPEGLYLVDDRGRKFRPQVARDVDPLTTGRIRSRYGEAHYAYPRLVFPRQAITEQTRAVSLYLAAFNKRVRFTWVFDPDYRLPPGPPGSGREQNRLFPGH